MLDKIQKFRESLTEEQKQEAQKILGPVYDDLIDLLGSKSLDEAKDVLDDLRIRLRNAPLKAIRLFGTLTEEQKSIVKEFLDPSDEEIEGSSD